MSMKEWDGEITANDCFLPVFGGPHDGHHVLDEGDDSFSITFSTRGVCKKTMFGKVFVTDTRNAFHHYEKVKRTFQYRGVMNVNTDHENA